MASQPHTAVYNVTEGHIVKTPGVLGGRARIADRRISVQNIYEWHEFADLSAQEISEQYDLTLVQVYAALTYAFEHLEEIKAEIRAEEALTAELKAQHPPLLKDESGDE